MNRLSNPMRITTSNSKGARNPMRIDDDQKTKRK